MILPTLLSAAFSPFALAATHYSLSAGGQPLPGQAVVIGGQTYVPLSALKSLGISSSLRGTTLTLSAGAAGGADQRASVEGCAGQTLFNGVWRLKVGAVRNLSRYNGQQRGYGLSAEWKNGSSKTIDALNTGIKNIQLVLQDGMTLSAENDQDLKFKRLPQGAGATFELQLWADSASTAAGLTSPAKLLIEIDPAVAAGAQVAYSVPSPSFRVNLRCP